MSDRITHLVIRQPDDWHVHLRDGAMLEAVIGHTAQRFARAIVMPNLNPPVTTVAAAKSYRTRILAALSKDCTFTPLMTAYLTDTSDAAEIERGFSEKVFAAGKLYPAHTTTNSALGVSDVRKIYPVFAMMQRVGMPLLVHGEVADSGVDIFDREAEFISRTLSKIVTEFPQLKIVFEHITTKDAVEFVVDAGPNLGATITPHHLVINRNAMFKGGIRPHSYCLPVAKREHHRLALRAAATSGNSKFFLGTDSAPHTVDDKQSDCGCAGIFNAPVALETYLSVFDEEGALDKFEAFASVHGPRFYGLPLNTNTVKFVRTPCSVPSRLVANGIHVQPFLSGETLAWSYAEDASEHD